MKLYGGAYIIPGLLVFLGLATTPLWRGAAAGTAASFQSPPNPGAERCLEPKEFMRDRHMQLLIQWREDVVRGASRLYTAADGRRWDKSLTSTCMACHGKADAHGNSTTAATYCTECHHYVGVSLYCWDCHVDPAELTAPETLAPAAPAAPPARAEETIRP